MVARDGDKKSTLRVKVKLSRMRLVDIAVAARQVSLD